MNTFDEFAENLPDQQLPEETQSRHLAYLRSLPETAEVHTLRPRRRKYVLTGVAVVVVAVAAGGGVAAAFGAFSTPTDTSTAFCYASPNLDDSGSNRVEFAAAGTPERPGDATSVGLDVCAAYWRSGVFNSNGTVNADQAPTGGSLPVPHLVACVLPDGQVGIFPGNTTTCTGLGLTEPRSVTQTT